MNNRYAKEFFTILSAGCVCADVFPDIGEICPGGESLNFCGNICRYNDVKSYLIGAVGNDIYGEAILEKIRTCPIDISHLHIENGRTATHEIHHTKDGDRYFKEHAWDGGVYDSLSLSESDKQLIGRADAVHTTLSSPVLAELLQLRKAAKFILAVDFNDGRSFSEWEELAGLIDVFFISGDDETVKVLREWSSRYSTVFVATLAERGSIAFCEGKEYSCRAVKVDRVIDTTGAGDSYQAGFIAELCRSGDISAAMYSGSLLASENITHLGGF